MRMIKKYANSLSDIAFPVTCACCGASAPGKNRYICNWCAGRRFQEVSGFDSEILPEQVHFVFSMWHFDKGGYLQDLLHNLKYNYLREVGVELGRLLARRFLEKADEVLLENLRINDPVLIPVPLHKSKLKKRGYNQANAMAIGMAQHTKWQVIDQKQIIRQKKTQTQTGLNSAQRAENLRDAFLLKAPETLTGRFPIIVDDVFTTGATTFELARTVCTSQDMQSGIITVAKA